MKKRIPKVIGKKLRGEWTEMRFMVRVAELGLPISKPWGDSRSFDFVVGWPRHFVAVQVKSTIFELEEGWMCTVCSSSHPYPPGSFDFLAAYIVFEDAWYIIPEEEILGMKSVSLHTNNSHSKYEKYRENWELLERAGGKVPSRATSKTFKVAPKNFRRCGLGKRDRISLQRLSY
jgi:hypothetical protein